MCTLSAPKLFGPLRMIKERKIDNFAQNEKQCRVFHCMPRQGSNQTNQGSVIIVDNFPFYQGRWKFNTKRLLAFPVSLETVPLLHPAIKTFITWQ